MKQTGIYVELPIRASLDRIWQLTQTPELHERWDLRFTKIEYLPKTSETQHFLYATRIGFGLAIRGIGESIATKRDELGNLTSSLRFSSEDPKSLIREGSGYWHYNPEESHVRFLTWYDYRVRFGFLGRFFDALVFRPAMGWATAWSFDRLRLWAERDQSPEASVAFAIIHALARLSIAFIWIWHGLVPKLWAHNPDELTMLANAAIASHWLPWIGVAEVVFGVVTLLTWRYRQMFVLNAAAMVIALVAVALQSPHYLTAAFNPVTLNLAVVIISIVGFVSEPFVPHAGNCLRVQPEKKTTWAPSTSALSVLNSIACTHRFNAASASRRQTALRPLERA